LLIKELRGGYQKREATFYRYWRNYNVKPENLAKAGFFYFNLDDQVQCVFCFEILKNWKPRQIPLLEHKKRNPNCIFVQKMLIPD